MHSKMWLTLTFSFSLRKFKCKYTNQKVMYDLNWCHIDGNSSMHYLLPYWDIQSKCAWPWHQPLKLTKVKFKYANRKPMIDFVFDVNSNVWIIHHNFRDSKSKCAWPWPWPRSTVNTPIESPNMTCYLKAIVIFSLSVNVSKKVIVLMCMTMTLSFRIGQGQLSICQSKPHVLLAI